MRSQPVLQPKWRIKGNAEPRHYPRVCICGSRSETHSTLNVKPKPLSNTCWGHNSWLCWKSQNMTFINEGMCYYSGCRGVDHVLLSNLCPSKPQNSFLFFQLLSFCCITFILLLIPRFTHFPCSSREVNLKSRRSLILAAVSPGMHNEHIYTPHPFSLSLPGPRLKPGAFISRSQRLCGWCAELPGARTLWRTEGKKVLKAWFNLDQLPK